MMMFLFFLFLCFMMIMMNYYLNKFENWTNYLEKSSPYECGFDQHSHPQTPISVQFFLISLIFLLFDIEIVFIIPMVLNFNSLNLIQTIESSFIVILILFGGVILEYLAGSFNWIL
nr:NADH dehydrogenase subunit 3 [Megacampsomeris sp. 1 YJY-2023a]